MFNKDLLDDVQPCDTAELAGALEQDDVDEQHPEMIVFYTLPELLSSLEGA